MDIGKLLGVFILWPAAALLPAAFFAYAFTRRSRAVIAVTALAWLAYVPYEWAMKLRILCSGECNIRVDLLLFYPLLSVLSVISLVVLIRAKDRR